METIQDSPPQSPVDDLLACECREQLRSACYPEYYKEHDGKRYCVLHYPGEGKSSEFHRVLDKKLKDEDFNFVGVHFPAPVSFEGVVSEPAYFTEAEFREEVVFNVQFGDKAVFVGAKFKKKVDFGQTEFRLALFRGTHFKNQAIFNEAKFMDHAYFHAAKFGDVTRFTDAKFNGQASFDRAQFVSTVEFRRAVFAEAASFDGASFSNDSIGEAEKSLYYRTQCMDEVWPRLRWISFAQARFKDSVSFAKNEFPDLGLTFAEAIFEKPERVTFSSVTLYPYCFLKVDVRRFHFFDVDWPIISRKSIRNPFRISFEREALAITNALIVKEQPIGSWLPYLGITFRQLAVNAEENNRYEEAGEFRYLAMHIAHKGKDTAVPFFPPITNLKKLTWWYWLLSGYGERVGRAFGWLLAIWLMFAFIFWLGDKTWWQSKQFERIITTSPAGKTQEPPRSASLTLLEAVLYSVNVSALQKPEPLPANKRAKAFVLLETLLGPIQAAFLILAVRRKFMR